MIQSNELRIGNCISYDGWHPDLQLHNKPMPAYNVQVAGLNIEDDKIVIECVSGERAFESCYEPIPLSPEILEKCGFVWSIYHQAFHKHNDGHETYDLNECYPSGYQFSTFKKQTLIGIPVQSLHQLQNLYFSLCGEELTYKQ